MDPVRHPTRRRSIITAWAGNASTDIPLCGASLSRVRVEVYASVPQPCYVRPAGSGVADFTGAFTTVTVPPVVFSIEEHGTLVQSALVVRNNSFPPFGSVVEVFDAEK